jgi:hypothetical protein
LPPQFGRGFALALSKFLTYFECFSLIRWVVCKSFLPLIWLSFYSANYFLCCAEAFSLMWSYLLIFAFIVYILGIIPKISLPRSMSWSFSLNFSLSNFIPSSLTFMSLIYFELIFHLMWNKDLISYYCMWLRHYPFLFCIFLAPLFKANLFLSSLFCFGGLCVWFYASTILLWFLKGILKSALSGSRLSCIFRVFCCFILVLVLKITYVFSLRIVLFSSFFSFHFTEIQKNLSTPEKVIQLLRLFT